MKQELIDNAHIEYADFQASGGWFLSFRQRNGFTTLYHAKGEAGSVDLDDGEARMAKFRADAKVANYPPKVESTMQMKQV